LKILFVAYPLLTVSEESAGGAEQVLWTLERELHRRAHDTWMAASAGSRAGGTLVATGAPASTPDALHQREQEHFHAISDVLRREHFDLIHDMSGSFWHRVEVDGPVLATIHLPREFYPSGTFDYVPTNVALNCVSRSHLNTFSDLPQVIGYVANGIALDEFTRDPVIPAAERQYFLWLGRICEEKGPHHALDVAHAAHERIIVGGAVYPFLYHQRFHAREVLPRLRREKSTAKFISSPSFAEKLSLIRNAKAMLLTSTVDETSSIAAMEAAACGTPVVALRRGAFPEVVRDGVTGYVADDLAHMQQFLNRVSEISPEACREYAQRHFSASTMAEAYERMYAKVVAGQTDDTATSLSA
jgi:glycosyltransferase involved in cell wall biosynthesis